MTFVLPIQAQDPRLVEKALKAPLATGKITRLTDHEAYDSHPRFSNDGKRIVFVSDRQEHTQRLFSMNCDGSQVELLTPKNAVNEGMWLP